MKDKYLILGNARHGKDTVAQMITDETGLSFTSSSMAAAEIFIYDELKDKYGYKCFEECFEDRMNHRKEWYELIRGYNKEDNSRLAKEILKKSDMYVGMRDHREIKKCVDDGLFDLIIGVYDPRKSEEPKDSFNINLFEVADIIILNNGSLEKLREVIKKITPCLLNI